MNKARIINATRAGMIRGKRFSPPEIGRYEDALLQQTHDDKVEVMMLYFAEVLHDELGFGMKRTQKILSKVDEHMCEWLDVENFNLDKLRVRVFDKTHFMFACDAEDMKHIEQLLTEAGYNVKGEKDLLDNKEMNGGK